MSYRIPDAEYSAIKESWRRAPRSEPPFTNTQAIEACHANIKQAARRERELRDLYDSLPPGDPRLVGSSEPGKDEPPLKYHIMSAVDDQHHWREYLTYYQQRARQEGYDTVVPVAGVSGAGVSPSPRQAQATQPQRPPAHDPRLPREPDDDMDDGVPF